MDHLKKILSLGISILIFPEGTQNRTKEKLQPFYDGAFRIAVETQEPLLPVVVVGANKLMPPGTIPLRPGKIKIVVGKAIPTQGLGLGDVSALKEQVRNEMLRMLSEYSA